MSLFSIIFELPFFEAKNAFERAYFEHHLVRENGSMTRVSAKTGLERTQLYRKIKKTGAMFTKPNKEAVKDGVYEIPFD